MEVNKIYNEDCFHTIKRITPKSIDVVITSPPYTTGGRVAYSRHNIVNGKKIHKTEKRYDEYLDTKSTEEYINWSVNLFKKLDTSGSGFLL